MERIQLLKDPALFPSDEVLSDALGSSYPAYAEFRKGLRELGIETEWRYYNDGKAWLGKNTYKKKTVFWLSVWQGYFKVSLFFTEKTCGGVLALPIDESRKAFEPSVGKLKPLIADICANSILEDLFKIIEYKQKLK